MGNYNCILANCIQLNGAIIITDFGALLLLGRTIRMKTLSSVRVSESGGLAIAGYWPPLSAGHGYSDGQRNLVTYLIS